MALPEWRVYRNYYLAKESAAKAAWRSKSSCSVKQSVLPWISHSFFGNQNFFHGDHFTIKDHQKATF